MNQVLIIVLICFMCVLGYTAYVLGKEEDTVPTSQIPLSQLIHGLNGPAIPDFPVLTLSQGSRPFTMDLAEFLGEGASIKEIQNANDKITAKIEDKSLTLHLDPFFIGSSELDFMVSTPAHKDPVVKTLKVSVTENKGGPSNVHTPALPAKVESVRQEKNGGNDHDDRCYHPYFPDHPLRQNELKLCHPEWLESATYYLRCKNDISCGRCMKEEHKRKARNFLKAREDNLQKMHSEVQEILATRGLHPGDTVMVTFLNKGYYYHWSNWVCSTIKNNISVRNYTLVVVFDDDSYKRATAAGFMVYEPKWIPVHVDDKAASSFALGPHGIIMVFEHMMRNELIHLGYDVMFQDTDIVWRHDPMPWLMKTHPRLDIQVMYDGRTDGVGPINSGFIFTRSNCRTKIYLQTMIDNIVFFLWDRASQPFVNALVHHRKFRQISMRLLDTQLFMNGNLWTPEKPPDNWKDWDPMVMHASWTGNHLDKINKWSQVDQWYLTPECPLWEPEIFTSQVCSRLKDKIGIDCKAPRKES